MIHSCGRKRLPFKRADVILIVCSLMVAVLLFCAGLIFSAAGSEGLKVRAYSDGILCLDESITAELRTVLAYPDGGENTVVIHEGRVYVESADCPGHDCVNMGMISKAGEEIICLPHRLVIRIEGPDDGKVDVMVR